MLDDPNKPDDTLDATARDYLGQPSPLAFKNQPALPSGGGSIGVGAGPNTTAGGTGASGVKRDATLAKMLTDMGFDPSGGGDGNSGGEAAAGVSSPAITGFDPTTANIGVNAASLALGVPGFLSLAGMLAGIPGLAAPVSGPVATAITAGKAGTSLAGKAGLAPASDLTLATPGSPGKSAVSPTYTGFFDALANAIMGRSNFQVSDDPTPTGVVDLGNPADNPSIYSGTNVPGVTTGFGYGQTGHPSFGFAGQNAPSQSPAPYSQTPDVSGPKGRGDEGNSPPSGPPGPGVGPPGEDDGGMGGVPSGPAGGGGSGGGGTFLCTALHKRGLMDDATLDANHRFARTMTRAEYVGYAKWARPLAQWGDRHPRAALLLYAVAGFLPRAYMAEIKTPGSSRLGRVVLAVGLRVCAKLGAPRARRRLA